MQTEGRKTTPQLKHSGRQKASIGSINGHIYDPPELGKVIRYHEQRKQFDQIYFIYSKDYYILQIGRIITVSAPAKLRSIFRITKDIFRDVVLNKSSRRDLQKEQQACLFYWPFQARLRSSYSWRVLDFAWYIWRSKRWNCNKAKSISQLLDSKEHPRIWLDGITIGWTTLKTQDCAWYLGVDPIFCKKENGTMLNLRRQWAKRMTKKKCTVRENL